MRSCPTLASVCCLILFALKVKNTVFEMNETICLISMSILQRFNSNRKLEDNDFHCPLNTHYHLNSVKVKVGGLLSFPGGYRPLTSLIKKRNDITAELQRLQAIEVTTEQRITPLIQHTEH